MATWNECNATIGVSSGKWYWEVLFVSTAELQGWIAGVRTTHGQVIDSTWSRGAWNAADDGYAYGVWDDGSKTIDGTTTSSFMSALSGGDIVGFLLDLDSGTTTFKVYVNNSLAGTLQSGLQAGQSWNPGIALANPYSGNNSIAIMNFGQDSSFAGQKTAQGNQDDNEIGDFYYDVPAGYLALCTSNLPAPEIADPTTKFNTVLWTGDDAASRDITGVGFQPDMVDIKSRTSTHSWVLGDSPRGDNKFWSTNSYAAEETDSTKFRTFVSDGFQVGDHAGVNDSSYNYVGYSWKAGGAPTTDNVASAGATPTAGSVKIDGANLGSALAGNEPAQRISANTETGFSIVLYDGTASADTTFAHGLSEAPEFILCRNLVSGSDGNSNPIVLAVPNMTTGSQKVLYLDGTAAAAVEYDAFSNTAPTASVFTVGAMNASNKSGSHAMVAYCFHSIEGFSKIGTYIGNGDADGAFVYTGFRPAYVIFKCTSASSTAWNIVDTTRETDGNPMSEMLQANSNIAEFTSSSNISDFLSNGIKLRGTSSATNGSGNTYIYLAFAETPFKTANAR